MKKSRGGCPSRTEFVSRIPPVRFVPRKPLPHETPPWARAGDLYFITIACDQRGTSPLIEPPATAEALLEAAAHYQHSGRWFARLFLLMPDHLHALLAFPSSESMAAAIRDWKRYTARIHGIAWQRDFFDHRLRSDESWEAKARYIRENPVRKGLVANADDWPWRLEA